MKTKVIKLGDICFIEKGKIGIQTAISGDYPLVTTGKERGSHNEYHFEGEAVCIPLVSATGHGHASIKRIHFQKGKFCVGNILCACMPKDYTQTSAKFLYLYFSLLKDVILVPLMQGSANVSLKIKDLEKVEVPDVSFERQLEIVDEFERLEVINNLLVAELSNQQTYLQLLRQTILQEAVQGKLTKQVATDEPATELLRRIKAEKQKLIKAGKLRKEKELPPTTEDEIPFELPKGWVWCKIDSLILDESKDLRTGPFGSALNKSEHKKEGVPVLGIESISKQGEFLGKNKIHVTELKAKELKSFYVKGGDLILSRSGTIGELCVLPENIRPSLISTNLLKISLNKNIINSTYFCHVIKGSNHIAESLLNFCGGTTRLFITQTILKKLIFPLPPLAEQQRIVAKVYLLQNQLSQLEIQVQQSREYAQQLLQSVLREAFEEKGKVYEMREEKVGMVAEE